MKHLFSVILFLIASVVSKAQFPVIAPKTGTPTTLNGFNGGVAFALGFINGRYADTTAANNAYIKVYPGAQIVVVDTLFIRNLAGTKWIKVGTGSSTGGEIAVVATIAQLTDYAGTSTAVIVSDSLRGGLFLQGSGTVDNGMIFDKIGTGEWIRQVYDKTISVKWFGAKGDGVTNDRAAIQATIDYCFGTSAAPHATINSKYNRVPYVPTGLYITTTPLNLTKVHGGIIKGDGRLNSIIRNNSTNLINTNGMEYTTIAEIGFENQSTTGILFNLDWDNSAGTALQSNTFQNCSFSGGSNGVVIGASGFMGSENLITNCYFANHANAGLWTRNYNALQNTVIGGNFQNCAYGILVAFGQVNVYSAGFQVQSQYDILVSNSSNDVMTISACRSESPNFALLANRVLGYISNCTHLSADAGTFLEGGINTIVRGCISRLGTIHGSEELSVSDSWFGKKLWLTGGFYDDTYITNVHAGEIPNEVIEGAEEGMKNIYAPTNILIGGYGQHIIDNGGLTNTWVRGGTRGALFFYQADSLAASNPSGKGIIMQNQGTKRLRVRHSGGIDSLALFSDIDSVYFNSHHFAGEGSFIRPISIARNVTLDSSLNINTGDSSLTMVAHKFITSIDTTAMLSGYTFIGQNNTALSMKEGVGSTLSYDYSGHSGQLSLFTNGLLTHGDTMVVSGGKRARITGGVGAIYLGDIAGGYNYKDATGDSALRVDANGKLVQYKPTGGGSGVTTMAAIGSSPNANGATISGSTQTLQPADATFGGVLTAGTQTIAGAKTFSSSIVSGGAITATTSLLAGATSSIYWNGRAILQSPADGKLVLYNQAGTDFTSLLFGGVGTSHPGIFRNTTSIDIKLADGSALSGLNASKIGIGTSSPATKLDISGNTSTLNTAQIGNYGIQSVDNVTALVSQNGTFNGSNVLYRQNGAISMMQMSDDNFQLINAASGTAGGTATLRIPFYVQGSTGAVGINNATPAITAILDVASTTKGLLIPRMTTSQMNAISSPATGLMVRNTDALTEYSYNGSVYKSVGTISGSISTTLTAATTITVTFGGVQPNTTYKVNVTPYGSVLGVGGFVNNQTTTTFDYVLPVTTGTVSFYYSLFQ